MAARPLVARQPNERLQQLIQEASCSNAGLARRVNLCGAEHGLDLRYDKTSVARWLRGQQPRGQAPAVIAEALGRKLGRSVSVEEIGMADGKNLSSGIGLQFAPTLNAALEQVCELWRSDVGRRDFLTGATVAASALVEPSRDWLITPPDPVVARAGGPGSARPTWPRSRPPPRCWWTWTTASAAGTCARWSCTTSTRWSPACSAGRTGRRPGANSSPRWPG